MNTPITPLSVSYTHLDVYKRQDVVFFENTTPGLQIVTKAGQYLIFNPWDAHKPKAANGEPAPIKKVIVKIKED